MARYGTAAPRVVDHDGTVTIVMNDDIIIIIMIHDHNKAFKDGHNQCN